MPAPTTIQGDMVVNGNLSAKTQTLAAGSVNDSDVAAGAPGKFVAASKLEHQSVKHFSQGSAVVATSVAFSVHSVYGTTGVLLAFSAGCVVVPIGAATVTVDLKVNGTSLLSAPITLNSSSVARTPQFATFATTALVAGNLLEVVTVATAGGGTLPDGVYADAVITEDPF